MLTSHLANHHYSLRPVLDVEDLPYATARCRSSIVSSKPNQTCRHLFHSSLSSDSTYLSELMQKKMADQCFREEYFLKLSRHHRWLLVLNDFQCACGCHFSMKQGSFVLVDQSEECTTSMNGDGMISVISDQLIRSKVPLSYVCDVESLRARVRSRLSKRKCPSFDL